MKKSKISIINELALLENIDIKNEKSKQHRSKEKDDPSNYFNKLKFHLKSRNVLKNEFFSKFLFSDKNNIHYKTYKNLQPKKPQFWQKVKLGKYPKTIYINRNNNKNLKKNTLSLNILNFNLNDTKQFNKKKFSYDEYRRKKYVNHVHLFAINDNINESETESRDSYRYNKLFNSFLYPKNKNPSKKTIFSSFDSKLNSLYNILPMKVHNWYTSRVGPKEPSNHIESKKSLPPRKNKIFSKTIYKKSVIDIIKSKNKPLFFISTNMNSNIYKKGSYLKICEKERYKRIMESLLYLKKLIEENTKEKFTIITQFLIDNGIYEQKYLSIEKLNKIFMFVNTNFEINATKSLKDNIIDILEGKILNKKRN